jgi:hypothetical protein
VPGWGGTIRTCASRFTGARLNSRRNSPDFDESGHQRLSVRLAELIPDAEVRILPPQPASLVSTASHMKVAQNRAVPRGFADPVLKKAFDTSGPVIVGIHGAARTAIVAPACPILECRCSNPAASASQSVSNASHMKVAQKPRGTARFLRYELVSVCGIWHGGAIPASCLRGPFFGVSFLVPYCPFGQACYPAVMIHDPIVGRLTSLLTHRGQQRLSPC